ncbi:gluconokinase [Citricoccus sp. GCM10030269]|uniref:gluconokinase n=1 Tax=Citricoccus sp. GCM10030269 TaxID=3273388 RepID=UPI0036134659
MAEQSENAKSTENTPPTTSERWPSGTSHLVVSGPSGSGKSTAGRLVATALGRVWVEGDAFHTVENRNKMAAGTPLTDEDRAPWLKRLAGELHRLGELGLPAVLACSALKRSYRDTLRSCGYPLTIVQIRVSPEALQQRVAARHAHFMPASLVLGQIALMEPLSDDEHGAAVESTDDPQTTADRIVDALGLH